jgi:hypothetical protein
VAAEGTGQDVVFLAEDQAELVEPIAALWAPGSAVLSVGEDATGGRAVAMWQVSPDGRPTGSWVVWHTLSRAAHHYAYELAPTGRELRTWHGEVFTLTHDLERRRSA